jgi:hypothetical protein
LTCGLFKGLVGRRGDGIFYLVARGAYQPIVLAKGICRRRHDLLIAADAEKVRPRHELASVADRIVC